MSSEVPKPRTNCITPEGKKYPAQRASVISAGRFGKYLEHPQNTLAKKGRWYFLTKF